MKLIVRTLFGLALVGVLMTFFGCPKSKPAPEPITDQQLDKLDASAWKVASVQLDGVTQDGTGGTVSYAGFLLTFTGTKGNSTFNYTTSGRPASPATSPWPAS